jgi:hypothetical protein
MVKETCTQYKFSYTIVPLEHVLTMDRGTLPGLDMRVADAEDAKQVEEEKKMDEEQHSTFAEGLKDVMCREVPVEDIEEKRQVLRDMMECLPKTSNFREDLILYFKRWLIVEFALRYNFKKVLFGTTGHKVATQLLAQLAKGRGSSIAHEISYIDDKNF